MAQSNAYVGKVRLAGGVVQKVKIEAVDANRARMMPSVSGDICQDEL